MVSSTKSFREDVSLMVSHVGNSWNGAQLSICTSISVLPWETAEHLFVSLIVPVCLVEGLHYSCARSAIQQNWVSCLSEELLQKPDHTDREVLIFHPFFLLFLTPICICFFASTTKLYLIYLIVTADTVTVLKWSFFYIFWRKCECCVPVITCNLTIFSGSLPVFFQTLRLPW